ncbi:MAG: glycolate oxidase subunit GlcE [Gammaproteobacteria bacterium]|nr:glycolate oxidase subunit GlcE [Gammaproteobacteria bacterium]
MSKDNSQQIQAHILDAYKIKKALKICGGNSKHFYGHEVDAGSLDVSEHKGIISYEPTELVVTVRAGTLLSELETTLHESNQILPFEPPHFTDKATIGGTIACNLSGPARAYNGAARDFVLGSRIINGKAEDLKFGGQVMKNVAGYDASRLMCGAMGTLGVILDVSLKVLPKPETEITLAHQCDINQAMYNMHQWVKQSLPVTASCYDGSQLFIRLSGSDSSVNSARKIIGGEVIENSPLLWQQIKEQTHNFFKTDKALWRLSLSSNNPPLDIPGDTLYEWGAALRWLKTDSSSAEIREKLETVGGHAVLFRNNTSDTPAFHPLSDGLLNIHKKLKNAFDPQNILNPGVMYKDI